MSRYRRFSSTLVAALILWLSSGAVAAQQQGAGQPPHGAQGRGGQGQRIWWNQERFVGALGLTEEQRGKMDAVLEEHVAGRRAQIEPYVEARRELADAVAAGDWKGAEAARDRLAELAAATSRTESDFLLTVAKLMSGEQRKKLKDEFPMLLARPWVRGGMGLGGGQRRRGGDGQAE